MIRRRPGCKCLSRGKLLKQRQRPELARSPDASIFLFPRQSVSQSAAKWPCGTDKIRYRERASKRGREWRNVKRENWRIIARFRGSDARFRGRVRNAPIVTITPPSLERHFWRGIIIASSSCIVDISRGVIIIIINISLAAVITRANESFSLIFLASIRGRGDPLSLSPLLIQRTFITSPK